MRMLDTILARRDELHAIARRHKARRLWVFGSVARREETPGSDVDFLVEFEPGASLLDQGGMSDSFGKALGRVVDVVDSGALQREPFFAYAVKKDILAI